MVSAIERVQLPSAAPSRALLRQEAGLPNRAVRVRLPLLAPCLQHRYARSSRRRRPQSATLVVGVRLSPTAPRELVRWSVHRLQPVGRGFDSLRALREKRALRRQNRYFTSLSASWPRQPGSQPDNAGSNPARDAMLRSAPPGVPSGSLRARAACFASSPSVTNPTAIRGQHQARPSGFRWASGRPLPPRLGGIRDLVFETGFLRSTRSGETISSRPSSRATPSTLVPVDAGRESPKLDDRVRFPAGVPQGGEGPHEAHNLVPAGATPAPATAATPGEGRLS